jgi:signal transduction histidine kinase
VAYRLHEEAAQVLAAVLLGLEMAQREVGSTLSASHIADLRSHLDATLGSLRELAVSLRAPVLDAMGLAPALEHLGENGNTPGLERIDVELGTLNERLAPELETAIFRVVEDAARITKNSRTVDVRYDAGTQELHVLVRLLNGGTLGNLAALRARVELLDGSVDAESDMLTARIPLRARDRGAFPTPHAGSARMP